ncbi:hypothetical protein CRUP_007222, partial [Coryphaenoides rupestris]
MGDSLELIGKRLFLLLSSSCSDGGSANGEASDGGEKKAGGGGVVSVGGGVTRDWLRGTVRAVSVIGLAAPEIVGEAGEGGGEEEAPAAAAVAADGLTVFVEFENAAQRCSWVQVYGKGVNALLVEDSIVWAHQSHGPPGSPAAAASSPPWPALTFRSLVDRVGLGSVVPVQFFGNGNFEFLPESKSLQKFEFDIDLRRPLVLEQPALLAAVSSWHSDFELQEIFRKGSYTIQGRR